MRLLVTGGAGFIGAVAVARLVAAGHDVEVLDDLSTGHEASLPAGVKTHIRDLFEAGAVLTPDAGFEGVLHFAGRIAAAESVARPELYWRTNVAGTLALLDAIRNAGVPRLVFSSTAAVYGNPTRVPVTETCPTAPTNPYGWTKLAADMAIAHACRAHGLGAVSLRYFNVAGAAVGANGLPLGERHSPETHLIPLALQVAVGERDKLMIFGGDYPTRDGTCVRDYIHVEDIASAHQMALDAIEPGRHQIYNLGNGLGFTNLQIVDMVRVVTGATIPVVPAPRRPGDPAALVASSARARDELDWLPTKPDLRSIVRDAWNFYRTATPSR
jgi:UDP-glucose 4-epimerase